MAIDSYDSLQSTVLRWLARPGDPLVAPSVPDMIMLFEAEANRRLRVGEAEAGTFLTTVAGEGLLPLPADFRSLRTVAVSEPPLSYLPRDQGGDIWQTRGEPRYYAIYGHYAGYALQLAPIPDTVYGVGLIYQRGVPPLAPAAQSNWLLAKHPDAYLFGTLAEAAPFIGHDERVSLWMQRRDATFAAIEKADRKARWGGPLQIRVDGTPPSVGARFGGGGGGGAAAAVTASPVRVVSPASGDTVAMTAADRSLLVSSSPLAALTIVLPPVSGMAPGEFVEVSFAASVTALTVLQYEGGSVAGGPTGAYGPGAAIIFRWIDSSTGWSYWK